MPVPPASSNQPPGLVPGDPEPGETLKRATSAALRAIAGRHEVTVSYAPLGYGGAGAAHVTGDTVRLPLPTALPDARQLGRLRGAADTVALRLRYHDESLHGRNLPFGHEAREVYQALEQARYEALGARVLKGVAGNISGALEQRLAAEGHAEATRADQVPLAEALRVLAHQSFGHLPLGTGARHLVELIRADLGAERADALMTQLRDLVGDQKGYAKAVRHLLAELSLEPELDDPESDDDSPAEADDEAAPGGGDDGGEANPESQIAGGAEAAPDSDVGGQGGRQEMAPEEEAGEQQVEGEMPGQGGEDAAGPGERRPEAAPGSLGLGGYRAFSTTHDQVVGADELCDPDELTRLRAQLDQQLHRLQGVVTRLANRLQRRLMARQTRSWEFDLEEGWLDAARLARVVANPTHSLSYKMEKETDFRDTVVTLLIDNSGSMRGRPITVAAMSADILARTLERCAVKVEVLGFTTSAWKGGKSREAWIAADKPERPGRLNDLRHIVYKGADQPWRRARRNLGLMLREGILKENIDGEALLWAHTRLLQRPEQRRILMVISDGAPVDDSTLSANPGNYLEKHLRAVIEMVENRSPVELVAIGIGHDVTRYYRRAVTLMDAEELGGTMLKQLAALFEEDARAGPGPGWHAVM
ncbi:cobaltochelatase CobT-related protein [Roseospirillum parvum]|uniref:Cobaltochelatase CobT n=1 Tax=Roseospirillum parvum TaxID=83401 RepID=A0A1G7UF21_9PROT|nr:cobaltochelatase subunit CobT [Roseospirillum parvum]SDG45908.1 cobaltochelatase CobT [Roseospirillum parvum]